MRSTPLALAVAAAAATGLVPSSAPAATGHWSSPVTITPASGQETAAAQAFVTPNGRSLVLTSDGARPLLAAGDVRGAFGTPVAIGTAGDRVTSLDGAVGPDGRVAVAWATGSGAHVALGGPGGGTPDQVSDFSGVGVNSVAVAIAPDGVTTVAFRAKDASGTYSLSTATAATGSSTFGAVETLDSGKGAIDAIDVAAGNGGAAAIGYRKLAPRYRTFALLRPVGAPAFEAPQGVSGPTGGDIFPRVIASADGSFVVGWGNPETGPMYVLRAAAGGAFGAPVAFGAGDRSSYVDMAPTPFGGAAATWSGTGAVRAAVAPAGGTFAEPVQVDRYSGNVVSQPAVAVAPDQTVTVADNHPEDGSIVATDISGAAQVIGYGPAGNLSPVAIAAGADRTVAVWRDVTGGLSAATRSDVAPPSQGPGAKPGPPDRTAPKLRLVGTARRVTFHRVPKTITLKVKCSEACVVNASGSLRLTVPGRKRRAVSPLRPFTGRKASAKTQTVTLRLGSLAQRDLAKAAKRGRGAEAFLNLSAGDAASNQARLKVQLTLKPAKKKRASR
jgi:hypothetical protein